MDTLKLKFKLQKLEFEIEGNQDVVKEQFDSFKLFIINDLLAKMNLGDAKPLEIINEGKLSGSEKNKSLTEDNEVTQNNKEKVSKITASRKPSSESYSIDRSLNLRGNGDTPSFKAFYEEKKPETKAEFNALAIYYLKILLKGAVVTLDQVYTCYKEVSFKPADYFKQSFRDAKSQHGYLEYDDNWNLIIPHRGISFVEHDLPKKKKNK